MSNQKAFWALWIFFILFEITFFYIIGELNQVDLGKSIILTTITLLVAYPIYRWVKSNDEFN